MSKDFTRVIEDIGQKLVEFRKRIPDTMSGFAQMAKATHTEGALSSKQKELIATAIAIATRCEGCLGFHAKACVVAGVSRTEFEEMIQVAVYMGGGPALMTSAEAMRAFEEFGGEKVA